MNGAMRGLVLVTALGLVMASSAQARDAKGEEKLAKLLAGRSVRAGMPCIEVRKIITTEIITGTAIVYRLRGSPTLYVNRPTAGLEDLHSNNALMLNQAVNLCEGNNLPTSDNGGRGAGPGFNGGVRLGEFVPYVKDN